MIITLLKNLNITITTRKYVYFAQFFCFSFVSEVFFVLNFITFDQIQFWFIEKKIITKKFLQLLLTLVFPF